MMIHYWWDTTDLETWVKPRLRVNSTVRNTPGGSELRMIVLRSAARIVPRLQAAVFVFLHRDVIVRVYLQPTKLFLHSVLFSCESLGYCCFYQSNSHSRKLNSNFLLSFWQNPSLYFYPEAPSLSKEFDSTPAYVYIAKCYSLTHSSEWVGEYAIATRDSSFKWHSRL